MKIIKYTLFPSKQVFSKQRIILKYRAYLRFYFIKIKIVFANFGSQK